MLTLRNSTFSVGTGMVHLLCIECIEVVTPGGAPAPGRAGSGAHGGAVGCCLPRAGPGGRMTRRGSEELGQLVGDRTGGLQRGPVADAGDDLDGGVAVGVGEFG